MGDARLLRSYRQRSGLRHSSEVSTMTNPSTAQSGEQARLRLMRSQAFQTAVVGPIVYPQDNSGVNSDTTTPILYRPEQFGAPDGALIIPGTVVQGYSVFRGLAYVENVRITEATITFDVFTQAAGGFPFGHHSGSIAVSTSFQWYFES